MRKILTVTAVSLLALSGHATARDVLTPLDAKFDQMAALMDEMGADESVGGSAAPDASADTTAVADTPAAPADPATQDPRKGGKFWRKGFWRKGAFWQGGGASIAAVGGAVATGAVVINNIDNSKSG